MKTIHDILFKLRNPRCSASRWQNEGMLQLCSGYYDQILHDIANDVLTVHSVWGYLRHIPRESETHGYTKDVYSIANKCFEQLYQYSQKKISLVRQSQKMSSCTKTGIIIQVFPIALNILAKPNPANDNLMISSDCLSNVERNVVSLQ